MTEPPPAITSYLEPAAKELAEATDPHPRIYEVPSEKGRDILLGLQSDGGVARPDVDEEWVEVEAGEWGTVRTRIIRPKGVDGPLPVMFYIHGAGWVFGDKTHDRLSRELAVGAGAAGVFPVYDRAPEAKYPTQVEQNCAVGQWVLEHGAQHGLDTSRIAVTGESVGGCMSAVFALMNKERGGIDLKAQVLLYPVANADFDTPLLPAVRGGLLPHPRRHEVVLKRLHHRTGAARRGIRVPAPGLCGATARAADHAGHH